MAAPYAIAFFFCLPVFVIYVLTPGSRFESWYGAPKLLSGTELHALYFGMLLLLFGVSAYASSRGGASERPYALAYSRSVPTWYLRAVLLLALFAYVLWFGVAVYRAGGISDLLSVYLVRPFYTKQVLLRTLPGVTTLTQLAVAGVPLALCYGKLKRTDRAIVLAVLLFAVARAFLHSERLALIELGVPVAYLLLSSRRTTWRRAVRGIVVFACVIIVFFVVSESRRSLVFVQVESVVDVVSVGTLRLLGYYLTSVNNALFLFSRSGFAAPFFYTFQSIWRFPGIGISYSRVTGVDGVWMPELLAQNGMNPEFNTPTAIGSWMVDFGAWGVPIVVLAFGLLSGVLYRHATHSKFIASLYSVWLVGLLELLLVDYFTNVRLFPAYMVFCGALFLLAPPKCATNGERVEQ